VCGRYAASRDPGQLVEEFEVDETADPGPGTDAGALPPDYNVAPTRSVPVILERVRRVEQPVPAPAPGPEAGTPDQEPGGAAGQEPLGLPGQERTSSTIRWLRLFRWGLVPSWAKDGAVAQRMINARAETLFERPSYRRPALARRCLVPADGWYEWRTVPGTSGAGARGRRQPYFLHAADGTGLAFAGLYEFWRDRALPEDDPGAWLASVVIVTTEAEDALRAVHDRMPMVLPRDRWDRWLDPRSVRSPRYATCCHPCRRDVSWPVRCRRP